jgi:hypothetical protein
MPIVVQQTTSPGVQIACGPSTVTAQNVVNSVSDDLLQRIAPEDPVLLDYINRVQLQLLRASRWKFLESPPQRFITQRDRSDYWIGPQGGGPLDVIDTGLNLTNLGPIKTDTFYDRSNFRLLKRTNEQILSSTYTFRDASSRKGPPRQWRNAPDTPCVINLYPAPDNQNNFQPQPEAPAVSSVVGGALPARIYFVRTTFIDSLGNESSASDEARVFIPANSVLAVQPPQEIPQAASGVLYNRFNVYIFNAGTDINATSGSETLANQGGPLSTAGAYIEPVTGFTLNGLSFPTQNSVEALGGYLIEFRYFQSKPQINTLANTLLIPADYFDVLVAGVNYFTAQFLKDPDAQAYWKGEYDAGLIGMIRDKNLFPRGPDYISPDPASQTLGQYYGYETEVTSFTGGNVP